MYFTAGFPAIDSTGEIIKQLASQGVDMIEIGVPFSDPMADGKTYSTVRPWHSTTA